MSIEKATMNRLKHDEIEPFTITLNETINAITDPAALGIYCYLSGKPEDWEISVQHLMNHFKKGREFINARLKYLRDIGAMIVVVIRGENGQFISRETQLKRRLPSTTRVSLGEVNPDPGETAPTKERYKQIKEKDNNIIMRTELAKVSEVVNAYHETLPENPKIKVVDDKLKRQIKNMINKWPSYQKDGEIFTIDSFKQYLTVLKQHYAWFVKPYQTESGIKKQNNLRVFTREINISKVVNGEFNE